MIADGNCFYRAISSAVYKDAEMHHLLRRMTMEHMLEDLNEYEPFFDSAVSLRRKIISNKRTRVWNSDLADIVPLAVARLLACRIHIYSVAEDEEVTHYTFGESGNTIRLLHHDNHYELLLK